MIKRFSERLSEVEELIFRKLDKFRFSAPDLIDLSKGLPVGMPPREILYELTLRMNHAGNHVYNSEQGLKHLRDEVAFFYKERFNVELDPDTEVQVLIGSREGIADLCLACTNPGDGILVPDPSFPAFSNAVKFARCKEVPVNLYRENNYIPVLKDLEKTVSKNDRLMFINYPHSPTGAVCTIEDLEMFVDFANNNDLVLCYDAAYRELSFDKHPTLMQVTDAKKHGVEIASFSKTFDMCGWRIAYMVGNKDIISRIRRLKTVFDVGQFVPIQYGAVIALRMFSYMDAVSLKYKERADIAYSILREQGYDVFKPGGAYFVWSKVPDGFSCSYDFMLHHHEKSNVLIMPGIGFGSNGEGYFRVSLTNEIKDIEHGLYKMGKNKI